MNSPTLRCPPLAPVDHAVRAAASSDPAHEAAEMVGALKLNIAVLQTLLGESASQTARDVLADVIACVCRIEDGLARVFVDLDHDDVHD